MARTAAGTRTVVGSARTVVPSARTVLGSSTKASHAIAEPTPTEAFDSGWAKLSGGGTVTDADTTHLRPGSTGAMKMENTGSGGNLFAQKTGLSLNFSTLKVNSISCWIYCEFSGDHTTSQVSAIIFFSPDSFTTSHATQTTYMSLSPGWNLCTFDRGSITSTASWTATMTSMRVRLTQVAGQTVTLWFDDLTINYAARPYVILDFDDAWDTVHSAAYPIMAAAGIVGNLCLTSSFIDDGAGHITTAHIQELYDAGWDVLNHADVHDNLKAETEANITAALSTCNAVLDAAGWTRTSRHGAWPNGGTGDNTDAGAAAAGMLTMRGAQNCLNVPPVIDNAYKLSSHAVLGLTESASTLLGLVDRAINGGYSIRLMFHNIIAGAPSVDTEFQTSELQTLITGLQARIVGGRLGNCSWGEYYSFTQGGGRPLVR